jgi:hypothetical protein
MMRKLGCVEGSGTFPINRGVYRVMFLALLFSTLAWETR